MGFELTAVILLIKDNNHSPTEAAYIQTNKTYVFILQVSEVGWPLVGLEFKLNSIKAVLKSNQEDEIKYDYLFQVVV